MRPHRRFDQSAQEEIRDQLAVQLQIDHAHLAAIPAAGLFRLREQLIVDALTCVLARRAGIAALEYQLERVVRSRRPELALVFVDVDGLKFINDHEGHAAGDAVLRAVANSLKQQARDDDIVFRYGGDEFVCAFPFLCLELASARLLAAWQAFHDGCGQSFSAGFAEFRAEDDAPTLIARADDCLYAGRRRSQRRDWRVAR